MKRTAFIILILLFSISAFAQTQKFDVMTYTPPKGWTQRQSGSVKTFSIIDKSAGKFCIMMLHPSITNHGTPSQDFAYVWKTLVRETFNASANPEKETTESDGFTINQGGELIEFEGNKALAMLTTISGKGKVISLLSIFNNAKYADDVQAFLGAIDIDIKDIPKGVEKPNTETPDSTKSPFKKDILGEWYLSNGNIKISLWLAVNGHYKRSFTSDAVKPIALNLYQTTTFTGDGTYSLNGNTLKIFPKNGKAETYQIRLSFETNSSGESQKILHLLRPVEGGKMYESDYYFVK